VLPFVYLRNYDYRTGMEASYVEAGALCFTSIIVIINLKVKSNSSFLHVFNILQAVKHCISLIFESVQCICFSSSCLFIMFYVFFCLLDVPIPDRVV
jgi:hypothetical protein